jgi:hypothetical protein
MRGPVAGQKMWYFWSKPFCHQLGVQSSLMSSPRMPCQFCLVLHPGMLGGSGNEQRQLKVPKEQKTALPEYLVVVFTPKQSCPKPIFDFMGV